jgi:hypothetical protein
VYRRCITERLMRRNSPPTTVQFANTHFRAKAIMCIRIKPITAFNTPRSLMSELGHGRSRGKNVVKACSAGIGDGGRGFDAITESEQL